MRRQWLLWLAFGLCVGLAAIAMTRVDIQARRLERAEAVAQRRAALEEDLQLALWRMDAELAPLVAEEGTRPYFHYSAFYPAERAYTYLLAEIQKGDVVVPSPLLTYESPRVRLHFQFDPEGKLSSPQVPMGNVRDLAEARYITPERLESALERLDAFQRLVRPAELAAALRDDSPEPMLIAEAPLAGGDAARSSNEFKMRSRSTKLAQESQSQSIVTERTGRVRQGPLLAVWIGPALVLARRVDVEGKSYLQGCWLDWDTIRADLLGSIADLLPDPRLEPVRADDASGLTHRLAAVPARLTAAAPLAGAVRNWSPLGLTLAIAWCGLVLAALAAALLIRVAISLSERRGAFASAVTHELRTPLTTFRLYTEMLAEGMVPDAGARRSYLERLRDEADRLGHLVENVLAYAQLERGRAADAHEMVSPADLMARIVPRLAERARRDGMELVSEPLDSGSRLETDITVVDRILSNLVDNAAKYARGAGDRRIHVQAALNGTHLEIAVRDHGPGLPPRALKRLFRPFSKSAHDAAGSAPGIGLGLALSRRLARALGGDLELNRNGADGACFRFTLPLAP
jgi:signal transduction histidine kinase